MARSGPSTTTAAKKRAASTVAPPSSSESPGRRKGQGTRQKGQGKTFSLLPLPFSLFPFPFFVSPIKASNAAEIRQLIAAVGTTDDVRREAAIARLAVIGARAVDGLLKAYKSTSDREMRIAILRALEPSGDGRTMAVARQAI